LPIDIPALTMMINKNFITKARKFESTKNSLSYLCLIIIPIRRLWLIETLRYAQGDRALAVQGSRHKEIDD
jgi:hypothetical protein